MDRKHHTSLYDILGVRMSASAADIKSSFRKLAQQHHPDKNGSSIESEARFKMILHAYSILVKTDTRSEYDSYLRTSSVFSGSFHRHPADGSLRSSETQIADPHTARETIFAHLNYILWDIEDLIRSAQNRDQALGGQPLSSYIMQMLRFIDTWVLEAAGFTDYFFQARNITSRPAPGRSADLPYGHIGTEHRPYVNTGDYFYNIRTRADKLMNTAKLIDLFQQYPRKSVSIMDCILESHNYCFHYLGYIQRAMRGEIDEVPQFHFSKTLFAAANENG